MDCTYCVLQGYVNVPAITVFVNVEDLLAELEVRWAEQPEQVWRLGTGEFGDSLALDGLLGLNELLIPRFAGRGRPSWRSRASGRSCRIFSPWAPIAR